MDLAVFEGFRQECVKGLPNEVDRILKQRNGFLREEVLFFATMGDGDYVQEMMEASVKILNVQATLEAYGMKAFL